MIPKRRRIHWPLLQHGKVSSAIKRGDGDAKEEDLQQHGKVPFTRAPLEQNDAPPERHLSATHHSASPPMRTEGFSFLFSSFLLPSFLFFILFLGFSLSSNMDFLKAEMEKKRKAMGEASGAGAKKYVRQGDLESARERKYWEEKLQFEDKRMKKFEEKLLTSQQSSTSTGSRSGTPPPHEGSAAGGAGGPAAVADKGNEEGTGTPMNDEQQKQRATSNISAKEVIKRLRKLGEPIRLFAEGDEERVRRLKALEEERGESMEGQKNDFLKNLTAMDRDLDLESLKRKAGPEHGKKAEGEAVAEKLTLVPITFELLKHNREGVYMAIHDYFKFLLREWEETLKARSEDDKRTTAGKSELAIMLQSQEYLEPFFKLCKKRQLPDDILVNIVKISKDMQARDYVQAYDTYCELSIGNAPWPIGVTMVGIHERSAREKIASNQVAHVLNDEKTRKWIQSMKRLMTFSQKIHPPDDLAKTIGYTRD